MSWNASNRKHKRWGGSPCETLRTLKTARLEPGQLQMAYPLKREYKVYVFKRKVNLMHLLYSQSPGRLAWRHSNPLEGSDLAERWEPTSYLGMFWSGRKASNKWGWSSRWGVPLMSKTAHTNEVPVVIWDEHLGRKKIWNKKARGLVTTWAHKQQSCTLITAQRTAGANKGNSGWVSQSPCIVGLSFMTSPRFSY